MTFSVCKVSLLLAVVCFILAAFGVAFASFSIGWLGLAFFAAAGLLP